MLRQLYPILLSITIALAIGVYLHPGEARVWIRQAGQWGAQVLDDTARATTALADEVRATASQVDYGSAASTSQAPLPYSQVSPNSNSIYAADAHGATTTLGTPVSPSASSSGYYQPSTASPQGPAYSQSSNGSPNVFPRVLANGTSPPQTQFPNQGPSPYYSASTPPAASAAPYTYEPQNPLRPSMEREAPWATPSNGPSRVVSSSLAPNQANANTNYGSQRVQWAQNRQADYAPVGQSQGGYLPASNPGTTQGTVDPYSPSQTNAGQTAPPTQSAYPVATGTPPASTYPAAGAHTAASSQHAQASYPASQASRYSLPPVQSGANPRQPAPYGSPTQAPSAYAPQQATSSPYGAQVGPAGPAGTSSQSRQPAVPYVASAPQQSHMSRPPMSGNTAIPMGAQIESPDPVADLTLCEGAQILARVGSDVVLGSEVIPLANQTLAGVKGIEKASESDIAKAREQLVKKLLPQHIELKLLYVDAKRNLPPEAIDNINQQLGKRFEEVEVSERLKKLELGSRRELEAKLNEWGTSLEHEKRAFIERAIAQQWVFEKLRKEDEVTHEQLLDYYHAHATEYDHPTRLRWEHLEVTFAKHPDKREAWQLIATMGNAVQQGQPFAKVAKERSEGVMASSGGQRDWLTQGSLKSEVLDRHLFTLPVGALSPIIEDETGFHIVRVVEREDAYRTPFEEIQADIREKIKSEKKEERLQEFVAKLREEIPVTTIFDRQTADSSIHTANPNRRF